MLSAIPPLVFDRIKTWSDELGIENIKLLETEFIVCYKTIDSRDSIDFHESSLFIQPPSLMADISSLF